MKPRHVYILLVIWGTVEVFLFAGLIFGWASLVYILKLDKYFNLCGNDYETVGDNESNATNITDSISFRDSVFNQTSVLTGQTTIISTVIKELIILNNTNNFETSNTNECIPQNEQFNLIYTLAVAANGLSTFFNGWVLDHFGTCLCRVCAIVMYASACLMIILSSQASSFWLFPAMIILTWSGYLILMTNFQLANLLPEMRSTIISLYCGAYDSSAFILVMIKFAYSGGVSVQMSFSAILILLLMVVVSSVWFMPTFKIPFPMPSDYRLEMSCSRLFSVCGLVKRSRNDQNESTVKMEVIVDHNDTDNSLLPHSSTDNKADVCTSAHSLTFMAQLLQPLYIWDVVWLTNHRFVSWSFVGRLNSRLTRLADGNQSIVSSYTSVFAFLQFFGIFIAPLSGMLMDRGNGKKNRSKAERLYVCIPSFILDSMCGLLLVVSLLVPKVEAIYSSFILHVLHRAMLYGPNSAFIATAFTNSHFGKLFGFAMSFSAGVSLLQYPLFKAIQGPLEGNSMMVDLVCLALVLLAFGHPLYIYVWCRRRLEGRSEPRNESPPSLIYKPSARQRTKLEIDDKDACQPFKG